MTSAVSRWQPGQLLMVGFEGLVLPYALAKLISAGRVGGVVLFSRNVEEPEQLRRLIESCHEAAPSGVPLLVTVDQEGGRVQRLREPWTRWPPMRALGRQGDLDKTRAVAKAMGIELAEMGIDLNFAPVVDVDSNPDNPVIGDRSFSSQPHEVSTQITAFIEGMTDAGVGSCAKHFPGHGDTSMDSHLDLPRLDHGLDRLRRVELPPFRAAIAAGVSSMMSAHVLFPKLDSKRPATLSPDVIGLLREELGYQGLVFSDDLEMKAVAKHFSVEERSLGALGAGIDSLLVCSKADLRDEVLAKLERAPDGLVEQAMERMVALKEVVGGGLRRRGDCRSIPHVDHKKLAEV